MNLFDLSLILKNFSKAYYLSISGIRFFLMMVIQLNPFFTIPTKYNPNP